jgi:signal transduction histidine kinase
MPDDTEAVPMSVEDATTQPVSLCPRILVIGDVPANVAELDAALEPMKRPVVIATSGAQALAHLQEANFSLAFLDVRGASYDGFEIAEAIRAAEPSRHVPIVFVADALLDPAAILRAYQLGGVDVLQGLIEPEIVLAKAAMFVTLQERTEQLAASRLQREALAEGDRRKNSFLAILGHELRNPLAPIRTAIDLIKASPDEPVTPRLVDVLDRQATLMARLVEDLLDLSRITANKLELRPERCDLRTVIDTALATSRPLIEQRKHTLAITLPDTPVRVIVDQVRFVQILTNVLNNAARYTPPGGKVAVSCTYDQTGASIRITDTGTGIPADLLPRIFDMFVQERVRSDGSGGLGLGLALARQLVEMHHGTIRATSAGRGAGSTFEITVPLATTEMALAPRTRTDKLAPLDRPELHPLRAVVIDDNADARELLAELLRSRGHAVFTAEDGPAGLAMIREQQPDVALVDLGLPGLDGVSLAKELHERCPDLKTRLIAITGYGHTADIEGTRRAGFHAHLVKPATVAAILAALTP